MDLAWRLLKLYSKNKGKYVGIKLLYFGLSNSISPYLSISTSSTIQIWKVGGVREKENTTPSYSQKLYWSSGNTMWLVLFYLGLIRFRGFKSSTGNLVHGPFIVDDYIKCISFGIYPCFSAQWYCWMRNKKSIKIVYALHLFLRS